MKTSHLRVTLLALGLTIFLSPALHAVSVLTTSYGYSTSYASPFILDTVTSIYVPGIQEWSPLTSPLVSTVRFNAGSMGIFDGVSVVFDPNTHSLNPGENGDYAIVRLTASGTSGTWAFNGGFWGQNIFNTTSDVHVLLNGTAIFDDHVNGFGLSSEKFFNLTVAVNPGDTIDFVVGDGVNGWGNDDTAVNLRHVLVTVPEPSGVLMLGLTGMALLRRRRKQPTL
jgi:plastocyanin